MVDNNTSERLIHDVCNIFREVTGKEAEPKREAAAIMHFARLGWQNYEFRLMIEHQFSHPTESRYFHEVPGRLTLRQFFNSARESILLDILSDLKHYKQIEEKRKEAEGNSPQKPSRLLMKCGAKIFREDYDQHMKDCFAVRGACLFKPSLHAL